MSPYRLVVSPGIFAKFPGYSASVVYAKGLHVEESAGDPLDEIEARLMAGEAKELLGTHPHVAAWREAYRSFGADPRKFPCGLESLLKRLSKGNPLPRVNPLVDAYNAVSLRHVLAIGGEDHDRLEGDLVLDLAVGDEPFPTSADGQPIVDRPLPGEVVWKDVAGVTCRRWNWRQTSRTRLLPETRNAYFVLDRLAPYAPADLHRATEDLVQTLAHLAPTATFDVALLAPASS